MTTLSITVKSEETQAVLQQLFKTPTTAPRILAEKLSQYFKQLASCHKRGVITVQTASASPVAASGTATCASVSVNDTITIGVTTLTAKASPASESEFSQAGTDTADALSLATIINAHSVLSLLVSASSALGVVTITSLTKSDDENLIVLTSSNGTRLAVSGSGYLTSGAGGANDAPSVYTLGI